VRERWLHRKSVTENSLDNFCFNSTAPFKFPNKFCLGCSSPLRVRLFCSTSFRLVRKEVFAKPSSGWSHSSKETRYFLLRLLDSGNEVLLSRSFLSPVLSARPTTLTRTHTHTQAAFVTGVRNSRTCFGLFSPSLQIIDKGNRFEVGDS
jgi:hypothetical protein